MDEHTEPRLMTLDGRGRISLGELARHERYLVNVEQDGTIVLTPAVVMSVAQAAFTAAPELGARIEDFVADPSRAVHASRPGRGV